MMTSRLRHFLQRVAWSGVLCFLHLQCIGFSLASEFTNRTVLDIDRRGIPQLCGNDNLNPSSAEIDQASRGASSKAALPSGARMWECTPGVVRNDGVDGFRVEVNVNGTVSNVVISIGTAVTAQSGQTNILLRDDGLMGDRKAGDFIFTSELLVYNTNYAWSFDPNYLYDTNSPVGVTIEDVGQINITEINGAQTTFLIFPQIGVIRSELPLVETVMLASNVVITPHLVNVMTTNLATQKFLRSYTSGMAEVTKIIYSGFPDAFDFAVHFSTYHLERLPYNDSRNFNSGVQWPVQVNFTGTGQGLFNNTATYGSSGRLQSTIALDSYERGILGNNCTHEMLHQWASYMGALAISDGQHYNQRSSVASLIGGFLWNTNGDGTWTLICEEGRNSATHACALDKYLMGLIPTNQVPSQRVYPSSNPPPYFICNGVISNVESTVTISNVIAAYGVRSPGPPSAQRDFSVGFVAESNGRLLTPAELTFYDIFAGHYTSQLPAGYADPSVAHNWPPITRFFGEGTTWKSDVLLAIRPAITSIERMTNGQARISGTGFPNRTYRLLKSTNNFSSWITATNGTAGTNGVFTLVDPATNATPRFYRVTTP
jgi:hypothetical protein